MDFFSQLVKIKNAHLEAYPDADDMTMLIKNASMPRCISVPAVLQLDEDGHAMPNDLSTHLGLRVVVKEKLAHSACVIDSQLRITAADIPDPGYF